MLTPGVILPVTDREPLVVDPKKLTQEKIRLHRIGREREGTGRRVVEESVLVLSVGGIESGHQTVLIDAPGVGNRRVDDRIENGEHAIRIHKAAQVVGGLRIPSCLKKK